MQTIEEYFEDYIKCYEVKDFDEHSLREMKRCFYAGAAAIFAMSEEIKQQYFDESSDHNMAIAASHARAIKKELNEYVREISGRTRVN